MSQETEEESTPTNDEPVFVLNSQGCCSKFNYKCWKHGIPLWLVVFFWSMVPILVVATSITVLIYTTSSQQVNSMYQQLTNQIQTNIESELRNYLDTMKLAAYSMQQEEELFMKEEMPVAGGYNPKRMIELMNSFTGNYLFESIGIIMKPPNSTVKKVDWEVANGFGCPEYIYAWDDESTGSNFYGYCAYYNGTIDNSTYAYNGTDDGLTSEEQQLISGAINETFMPIFALLDYFTLTYGLDKWSITYPGQVYGFSFAERSLQIIDAYVKQLGPIGQNGIIYVVERESGLIVTASVSNQTVSSYIGANGQLQVARYLATNATNVYIRESANYLLQTHPGSQPNSFNGLSGKQSFETTVGGTQLLIDTDEYTDVGLDWLVIIVIPASDFFSTIQSSERISIIITVVVIIAGLIMTLLWTRLITKPLWKIKFNMERMSLRQFQEMESVGKSGFREIREIQDSYSLLEKRLVPLSSNPEESIA